jgi:methionyl-tRNA formyltransferase
MGTAELAGPILLALHEQADFEIIAVVTQPDRPKGRHLEVQPSALKQIALATELPVLQPERARNPEFIDTLKQLTPDLIVVVAYGQILPQVVLDVPRFGCLNVHTSLLPKYRGAAPIQWAILEGESETGVTIMKMDAGMDTGPILTQTRTPIAPEDDSQTLHDRLAELGAELIAPTIRDYISGKMQPRPQPEGASHARKISKEDGRINGLSPPNRFGIACARSLPGPARSHFKLPSQSRVY